MLSANPLRPRRRRMLALCVCAGLSMFTRHSCLLFGLQRRRAPPSCRPAMKRSPARYIARTAYLDPARAGGYERDRFSGALGRYRWRREMEGVGAIVEMLPAGVSVLDCPCGIGRWWPVLGRRASAIHGIDLSPAMLDEARGRIAESPLPIELSLGDAEQLELADSSVDVAFSHALTKHLPIPLQLRVLTELARVSRSRVICSFSIVGHLSYEFWRRRDLVDSYPLLPEQLDDLASSANLTEIARRRCTTPLGVEHAVLFRKHSADVESPAS